MFIPPYVKYKTYIKRLQAEDLFNIKWDDCCDSIREYYIYKLNITIYKKKRWKYELLQTTSISEE